MSCLAPLNLASFFYARILPDAGLLCVETHSFGNMQNISAKLKLGFRKFAFDTWSLLREIK